MTTEHISHTLKQLHEALESRDQVDPDTRKLLLELDRDIHKLIGATDPEEKDVGIVSRLEGVAASLAADHPQLECYIRELADTLGKMGI